MDSVPSISATLPISPLLAANRAPRFAPRRTAAHASVLLDWDPSLLISRSSDEGVSIWEASNKQVNLFATTARLVVLTRESMELRQEVRRVHLQRHHELLLSVSFD
jgi:hypothetical protein